MTVDLFAGICPADLSTLGSSLDSMQTDANGLYLFTEVDNGDYCVVATNPGTSTFIQGVSGQDVSIDANTVLTADFGFAPTGSIGNQTYIDQNLDRSFDGLDVELSFVTVELYAGACPADLTTLVDRLAEITSSATGEYLFDEVAAGDYCVVAETPAGYEAHEGAAGQSVTVTDGYVDVADFGYTPLVSIGDYVYVDDNQNGSADTGEAAIVGADVTLYAGLCPASGAALASTQTDVNGAYLFSGLSSGDYCVEVTNANAGTGIEGAGGQSVTLTTTDVLTADFGFVSRGEVGDQIYTDNDQNGSFDPTVDTALASVIVGLYAGDCPADLSTLNSAIDTTTTDANGQYRFTAVAKGDYCVVATNPGTSAAIEGVSGQEVTVDASIELTADFGFAPTGSIGDQIYVDVDYDGVFGVGDATLSFVEVTLYAGTCPADLTTLSDPLRTVTSDADGVYIFDEVPNGDYCVTSDTPADMFPNEGGFGQNATVNNNAIVTADFGFTPLVSVGDFVFFDEDQDNTVDAGEPGIAGAEVTLYAGACVAGAELATTLTDVNGFYAFNDLTPGTYCVDVTSINAGVATLGSGGHTLTVEATDIDTADFGFFSNGEIGDRTYTDNNANGVYDAGIDTPLANVTVDLFTGDCPADISTLSGRIDTAQTDASGLYLFTAVDNGDYCVVANNPGASRALEGSVGQEVTVEASSELTADFGFAPTGSIGDQTYVDTGLDGTYSSFADPTLPNVKVELYAGLCPADLTTLVDRLAETTTDANGAYLFDEVAAGDYCVIAENPGAYEAHQGAAGHSVTVATAAVLTADFGYTPLVSIGDYVYVDNNQNSTADVGEPALEGVEVFLFDGTCPSAGIAIASTLTDVNGAYLFEGLASGDYCVDAPSSSAGIPIQGAGGQDVTLTITDVLTADFGFAPDGQIGDQGYIDNDGNGSFDPTVDTALPNVIVDLYTGDCPANLSTLFGSVASALTDANGQYLFDQVASGDYCVVATNPGSSTFIEGVAGQEVTVANSTELTADFGFAAQGSIGNQTYVDNNVDQTFDLFDVTLSFVTVELYAGACPADLATLVDRIAVTTSDANGVYLFDEVAAGDYCVIAENPGDFEAQEGAAGQSVTVTDGYVDVADFGYTPLVNIGDYVYVDNNQNGSADAGEPAIEGADVTLYEDPCFALGFIIATTQTDVNGAYLFEDLPTGDYCVRVSNTDRGAGIEGAGGQDVTLTTTDVLTADFGFAPDGQIGDQAYIDNDGNLFYDSNDLVLSNVTVNLYAGDCPVDLGTLTGLIDTVQTDANGQYLFTAVPDGDYCVVAINPGTSTPLEGADGQEVTVANSIELTADFGFAPQGSIDASTYVDGNTDGTYDPTDESTLANVKVELYAGACPADLTTLTDRLAETTSDANGAYSFGEVPDGEYCVVATIPGGFEGHEGATGHTVTVAGSTPVTPNFGYTPLVNIGDYVYVDNNQNGSADAGEPAIEGADVTLYEDPCFALGFIIATTQTDVNGAYLFEDLPTGDYCVRVSNTDRGAGIEGAGGQDVTLTTTDVLTADFGFAPDGQIGDQAYIDNDGNLFYDSNDLVLSNVTVNLYAGDCPVDLGTLTGLIDTVQTDANGQYLFTAVPDGDYCVVAINPGTSTPLEGADGQEVTVANSIELTADFGFAPQGSIGDTTYVDFNFDGSFDANGDDVLPNVKVELYAGACPADLTTLTNRLREVTSDANGAYTFTEVADGDYCVVAENPGAYEAQEGSIGHSVTVSGTAIVTADFGYTPLVSLGDYVYIDGNQNGAADDGEPAIAGADVTLYDGLCPAGLVIVATTQTDVNGAYLFEDLPSGDYCVEVTNTGAGAGIEGAGGQSVTLTTFDVLTADFGFTPAGAIGDQTYIDNNQDQNYDASVDQILAGVQVDYYAGECPADLGTLGASLGSQLTDANGLYLFDAVTDGIYCVVATNPGLSDALEGAFGQTVVVEGLEVRTADFGFAARGSIGNQTYVDANLDDTFDNLDTALPFVTVDLYAGSCPADLTTLVDRLRTTETDINGVYTFDQVPDGDYCVVAEVPGSYDPREGEFGQSVTVSGNAVDTADFGYAPWVSIGDFVYVDNDQSVSADAGEPAIAGAEVTLYDGLCAANGAVLATTLTDVNGYYAFDDLPPGDYCVEVTEHDAGTALQGAGGQSVVLGHTDILTIDFGFAPDGAIGDQTYIDSDQNGVYGLDDKIVSNVTVNLYAGDCPVDLSTLTGLIDTAQTDANGQYLFTQVPDGDYCVVAINPGSSIALEGVAGQEVTVAGGTELTADFGFAPTGSVGDLTYIDYDLDGVFGVGDEITPFVTIGLYPGLCPADLTTLPARLRTTNSDVNGLYLFAEVADGDYCVVADGPDGFQPIEGAAGQSVTVLGDAVLTADFGYAPLMTIGDFVYTDNNLDGSADAGDVPIPGATVTLEANACDAATRTVVATTQTDFNGLYSFDDLVPGEYCVSVINTAYGAAYEGAGEQSVTLVTTDRLDIDFGFAPAGSVGDMVYTDNERNGAYDPTDDALADATVELYAGDCPADLTTLDPANLVATTTSDANGLYLFTEVPDGDYCVTATSANTGEAFEGKYGQEVEVQGGEELSADFGFGAVGTIGDFVYYDTNVDGAQDINEPGHDNISVLLYTGACPADLMQLAVPYDITISDVNGAYLFDQLPAGDYCVIANDGGIDTQLEGAGGHTVTVNQDDTTTADFGYVPRATIGDTVYADDNGTLLQDGTEPGLLGVPVQLFRGLCDAADPLPLDTFLTTIDGLYSFTDLPAGEYCVRATPGAVGTLTQGAGGQSVTLYGVDQLDADFGVQRSGDLRLIKEVSDLTETPIARGDQVIFDLRVFNESSIVTMTEIELTDFLPDGYTFISATDGGVHDGSLVGGNVVWTIDSIAPRMTQTVSVTLLVNETGSVNNEAEITSTRQPDTDSETGNRSQLPDEDDTSTFSLPTESVSDLVLTKTVLDPAPLLGEQATFELTVVNNGPSDTSNVTISDILPNGLAFVSASEPLSTTAIPMEYIWTIGDLAAGETQTLTMVVDTLASHTEKLDYTNIAEVATSDSRDPNATAGNMIDPNEDDEASSTVYPSAIALGKDLIAISDPASGAEGNFEATFELLVHNTGATELVNIELIDDLISQMGAGFVETLSVTISEPAAFAVDQGNVADSDALLNTAFLGTNPATEVIRSDANVSLAASDRFVITLIVEVSPDKAPDIDNDGIAGPITNVASISASVNPMGLFPTSVPIDVTDDSDDDHDLNGTSDSPNDTNTDPVDDPTGVPGVSLAKDLISAVQPAVVDGVEIVDSIAMTVEHTVTNIGGVPLRNLEFRENLLNSADQVVSIIDEGEIVFDMPLPGEWTADNLDDGYASVPDFRPFLGGASILGVGETLVFQTTIVAQLDPSLGGEFENISTIIAYADVDNDGSFETEISDTSDNNGLVDEETDRNTPDGNSSNDPTPLPSAESDKVILDSIVLLDATANVFRAKWGFRVTNTGEMDLVDVGIWDDFAAQNDTVVSVDAVNITLIDDTAAGSKWSVSQSNFLDDDWITTPLSADMVEFGDGNGNILEPGGTLYFEAEVDFTMGEIDGLTTVTNQARLGGNGDEDGDGNADEHR